MKPIIPELIVKRGYWLVVMYCELCNSKCVIDTTMREIKGLWSMIQYSWVVGISCVFGMFEF